MDGELDTELLPSVISSVYQASGREQWDIYHHIGDVLRSERWHTTQPTISASG